MRDFNHTVNVLVKAYLNDTLVHGNCYACAVGNMVADGLGTTLVKKNDSSRGMCWSNGEDYPANVNLYEDVDINQSGWGSLFCTSEKQQEIELKFLDSVRVKRHIAATGYSWEELARIEFAFETADRRRKDRMFLGLMKVVDVLAEIHGIDLTQREEAKLLFVKDN